MDILKKITEKHKSFEDFLYSRLDKQDKKYPNLFESCNYSLQAGGKRIRPFLVREFAALFGGDDTYALPLAAAIEMIHTYSLIHDDLPCMDNDALRRGKPSNHIAYGEATALLAGDALLTYAFELIASSPELPAETKVDAIHILSHKAGIYGMIGGQQIDLQGEESPLDFETLLYMNSLKTGALMEAACMLGVVAAKVPYKISSPEYIAAQRYAHGIGIAFQIIDDILDVSATTEELGKPVLSDADNQKTTFMSFFDIPKAKAYALDLTNSAKEALAGLPNNETLLALADYLQVRSK